MNEEKQREIALKLSEWYCKQDGTVSWLKVKDRKYVSMASSLGKNSLDLKSQRDLFKLFTLALNWNSRKYGRFESGLSLFKILDDNGFIDKIYNEERKFLDWERIKEETNIDDMIIRSYFYLRKKWNEINPSPLGSSSEVENYIDKIYKIFHDGHKKKESLPLRLKIFFVLRELKSQGILEIDGKYCCIPDSNVCKMMCNVELFSKEKCSTLRKMMDASKLISSLFNENGYELFDMPLFWFYRTHCARCHYQIPEECIIYDRCKKGASLNKIQGILQEF